MLGDIRIMQVAAAMARHAAQRHAVVAQNIANADTPGYRARDLPSFSEALARGAAAAPRSVVVPGAVSPNGNTVSLEDEMLRASSAARDHDVAVSLYAKSIGLLRAALGKGR